MTDEEIRIYILEKIGWTELSRMSTLRDNKVGHALYGTNPQSKWREIAPNPITSATHVQAAIDKLIRIGLDKANVRLREYRNCLAAEMGCAWYQSAELINATPVQKARALYKFISKEDGRNN